MLVETFQAAEQQTLKTVTEFLYAKRMNMMFAGASINTESAQVAHLLSRLLGNERHYSFFGNSSFEALSGAIKLARHTALRQRRDTGGRILLVDESDDFAPLLDPLGAGEERAIVPGVRVCRTVAAARTALDERQWAGVVLVRGPGLADASELLGTAADQGALRILCHTRIPVDDPNLFASGLSADVHVYGENLTGHQVPFGSFTMTRQAYSVWKNPSDSLAHTSTFGGNGICLTVVIETLRRHGHVDAEADAMFRAIDEDISVRTRAFRHHVNPYTATGMELFGCNLDVEEASGGRLTLRDGRVIFDCAGGTGASLRGHNPPDVTSAVLAMHDSEHDYFEDLARGLAALTPFPEAFPAVSGATAVDIALTLALLASPGRRKIVTFRGNYSGKSLPSMNFSKHGPTATASDQGAFDPYYPDVVYVDPFRADAVAALEAAVAGGDVALVWFELSQGFHCLPLPDAVIEAVGAFKERHGYLVGVDEILTGFWRTGPKFLAHEGRLECDLTTLAKPLSDMIMPFGVALATSSVVAAASAQNSEHVAMMRRRLRNGLGSHIALHALTVVNNPEALESRERAERLLTHGLARVAAQSPLFEGVAGTGIHVRLVPKRRWFPFHARSQVGQLLEASMTDLILSRCNVMVAQQRFFHALFAEEADVAEIITRLEAGTRTLTPITVYRNVFARLRATVRLRLSQGRRGPKGSTS